MPQGTVVYFDVYLYTICIYIYNVYKYVKYTIGCGMNIKVNTVQNFTFLICEKLHLRPFLSASCDSNLAHMKLACMQFICYHAMELQ